MMAALRDILPKRLYSRSLLIVVTPMLLIQITLTYVFLERHWDRMTRRLSDGAAGSLALIHRLYDDSAPRGEARQKIARWAGEFLDIETVFVAGGAFPAETASSSSFPSSFPHLVLSEALGRRLSGTRFSVSDVAGSSSVEVISELDGGILRMRLPLSRIYATKTQIFFVWVYSLSFLFLAIAVFFLRAQVKPIERLAEAARRFGRGQDAPALPVRGAYEVREAAMAFLSMRRRIQRHLLQRTEFLAGVSHDMRTPLTRMKLQLEMMPESDERSALRADLDEIESMLESYLDFARGDSIEQESEDVDIGNLVASVGSDPSWRDRVEVGSVGESFHVHARRGALRRCLENLIANACLYANRAWISASRKGRRVEVIVDDDGPGIAEADRERAFGAFQRLDSSRDPDHPGTGLGLTIARDIARSHGGDIILGRSPRGGLRARLWLPS